MAKKRKLPKRPKIKSSLAVWERYHEKVKEVHKYNNQLEADKKKKATLIAKRIS